MIVEFLFGFVGVVVIMIILIAIGSSDLP